MRTAGVLRAGASARGVPLKPASPTDLVAAAGLGHLWCIMDSAAAVGAGRTDEQMSNLAARIFLRAAGEGQNHHQEADTETGGVKLAHRTETAVLAGIGQLHSWWENLEHINISEVLHTMICDLGGYTRAELVYIREYLAGYSSEQP